MADDEVLIRFSTRGTPEAAADIDQLAAKARQLGTTVAGASAQSNDANEANNRWLASEKASADAARAAAEAQASAAQKAASNAEGAATAVNRAGRSADVATQRSGQGIAGLADGVRSIGQVSPAMGHVANILDGLAASSLGAAGGLNVTTAAAEGEAVAATTAAGATTFLSFALGGIPLILSLVATGLALFSSRGGGAKNVTDDLTDAIIADTKALAENADAINENVQAYFTKELRDLAPELNRAGITFGQVTTAAAGTDEQFGALIAKAGAAGTGSADLVSKLYDLRSQFVVADYYARQFADAGGIVADSMNNGADAADAFASSIGKALDQAAAPGNLAAEQEKLADMLKDDGSEEHAKRVDAAAKAQNDATKATAARVDAERKLGEVNKRNLADEIARAQVDRDRAAMNRENAQVALQEAILHEQRVGAAGGSEKARADANRATRAAQIKVDETSAAATDADAKLRDIATGAALERDRAAAILSVNDARRAEKEATDKLGKALTDARVPASKLGASTKDIADQLDRVVRAGLAAGVSLVPMLDAMATKYPQIADAVERIESAVKTAIYGPVDLEGVNYYASGGQLSTGRYVVGERGPEVLDMYGGGSGYVYPNYHPLTKAVLGRADGGSVGSPGSVRSYGASSVHVVEVGKTTREGDFTGNIYAQGLTLDEVRREARRDGRRRANSRVSRGR